MKTPEVINILIFLYKVNAVNEENISFKKLPIAQYIKKHYHDEWNYDGYRQKQHGED